jgi:hypothetical protein
MKLHTLHQPDSSLDLQLRRVIKAVLNKAKYQLPSL